MPLKPSERKRRRRILKQEIKHEIQHKKPAMTKRRFMEAYRLCRSREQMSTMLGMGKTMILKYSKKFNVEPPPPSPLRNKERAIKIGRKFEWRATVASINEQHREMSRHMVRRCIKKALAYDYEFDIDFRSKFPPPRKLRQIKIIRALQHEPDLYDEPDVICTLCDLSFETVMEYLYDFFEFSKTKPESSGRRTKDYSYNNRIAELRRKYGTGHVRSGDAKGNRAKKKQTTAGRSKSN